MYPTCNENSCLSSYNLQLVVRGPSEMNAISEHMSVKFQRDLDVGTSATSTVAMHARPLPGTSMRHRRTHKSQPSWFAKAAILDRSVIHNFVQHLLVS